MKLLLSLLIVISSTALCAQSTFQAYYYADGQRISLRTDRSSLALHFYGDAAETELNKIRERPEVSAVELHPHHNRVLVFFAEDLTWTVEQWAAETGFSAGALRSACFALTNDDGTRMWLTHDLVYQPLDASSTAAIAEVLTRFDAVPSRLRFSTQVAELEDPTNALALGNALEESGLVRFAHPDFYAAIERQADPLYDQQFQLNNTGQSIDGYTSLFDVDCNAPEAWTVTLGDPSLIVAVIDDGVEAHEDLETGAGVSRVLPGFTPATGGNGSPGPGGAHGQACSGIVAASHNNLGVRGIAPNVRILPVNIFAGGETSQDLADAFTFAKTNGAAVISNSWGYSSSCGLSYSNLTAAINDAATNGRGGLGCVIAFSSGNDYNTCVNYPANLNSVLAVGAVTSLGARSNYSNQGSALDLVAPSNAAPGQGGAGVRTLDRMGSSGYSSGNYISGFGGTSAACPVVAGVAALLLSNIPGESAVGARNILIATASDMGSPGFDNSFGYGRVNAAAALSIGPSPTVTVSGLVLDDETGNGVPGVQIRYEGPAGPFTTSTDALGEYSVSGLIEGEVYLIYTGKWGYEPLIDVTFGTDSSIRVTNIVPGYGDEFDFDLGWSVSSTAGTGAWVRDVPIGTDYSGLICNPDLDAADIGPSCYMTGNGGGTAGNDDVDGGYTILNSPVFDLGGYSEPWLRLSKWFFNDGGSGTPDDQLSIRLSNGSTTVTLQTIGGGGVFSGGWSSSSFRISDFLSPTSTMQLIVETADDGAGHLVEAGFDRFLVYDSVTTLPPTCLSPPNGLNALVSGSGVMLSWNSLAAEGAVAYLVSGRRAGTTNAFRTLAPVFEPATSRIVPASKLKPGWTYEWKVQADCGGGTTSPESSTSTFTWTSPKLPMASSVLVSPNPASDFAELNFHGKGGVATLRVADLDGRIVYQRTIEAPAGPHTLRLDAGAWPAGMYQISLYQNGELQRARLIIAR